VRHKSLAGFSGGMRQRFGVAQSLIGRPQLVIVDEPTAGLDPEEANRFLNILSEIAENTVVILSTHIVQDAANLCPRTAIMVGGRRVCDGSPRDLIARLKGRIWQKTISKGELARHRDEHDVIATMLQAGRTVIHVLSDANPGAGFTPADGRLEDVYFATISSVRRAA
jgi:ABC-type multidrug transport system ATPase subunit